MVSEERSRFIIELAQISSKRINISQKDRSLKDILYQHQDTNKAVLQPPESHI